MRALHACIALCLIAVLGGCALNLGPAIGADLPSNPAMAQQAFDQRIRQRYPVGSSEAALVSDLRRQGFGTATNSQSPPERFRNFAIQCGYVSLVPTHTWEVQWTAVDGRITDIAGVFIPNCH